MSNESNSRYSNFRSTMHIVMGVLYIAIGSAVLYLKLFGKFELSPGLAYFIGIMMISYGAFRIWRGWKDIQNNKQKSY
ncbi:MAG: hypothetical protein R2800_10570 [Flavipsychrobacter sp.]